MFERAAAPIRKWALKDPERAVGTGVFLLYLYFLLDFFLRFSARFSGYGKLRPTLLVFAILCCLLFIHRDKLKDRFDDPIFRGFFVLLGYLVVSLPLVEWPGSVVRHNIDNFVLATCFLFFTALIIDTDRRLKWFLIVFVGCQVFRVLEPLYLNLTQGYWGSDTYLGGGEFAERLAGAPADVINANELGFVIVTAIPFLHYLLFPIGWKSKLLYAVLMAASLYALMLTMSRGAFIALLVIALMIFKESRHKLALIGVGIGIAVLGWGLMTPVQQDRYLSLIDTDTQGSAGVEGRFGGMKQEFRLGMERPIVGHGLGTTEEAKFHSYGSTQASHNLYAEVLIELGIIGAIIFLTFLWRIYQGLNANRRLFENLDKISNPFYSRLNTAMIAVFWMYAVYSINYWGLSQYYWYLFAGLAIAFGRLLYSEYVREQGAEDQSSTLEKVSERYPLAKKINPGRRLARG